MDNLKIEQTDSSFGVDFNYEKNILKFWGESRPENCLEFFAPILKWIDEYNNYLYYKLNEFKNSPIKIDVEFKVDYFNSTSAKYIFDLLMGLQQITQYPNVSLQVNWYYKALDEDMLESGEEFSDMTGLNVNLVPID